MGQLKPATTGRNVLDKFLKGPGQTSPIVDKSTVSIFFVFRDLFWFLLAVIPSFLLVLYERIVPKEEKDVKEQVVVITGAGSGIGRELAINFINLGSKVACVDINKASNDETVELLKSKSEKQNYATGFICDVADVESTKKLAEDVVKMFGRVDILIHNAGVLAGNTILGPDEKFIKRVIDVNLMSTFWMIRSFLPTMKQQKCGQIVVTNSILSIQAVANTTAYSAAKAGLSGLMDALTRELREDPATANIKLTSVHPWWVNTHPKFAKYVRGRVQPKHGAMKPKEAARQMVVGIRREYDAFVVPGIRTSYTLMWLFKLLPTDLYNIYKDITYCSVQVPEGAPYVPPPTEQLIT